MKNSYSFIRHGKTEYNQNGIFMGTLDVPLSEEGRQQAKALQKLLQDVTIDVVYSSPLKRAYETAEIILGFEKYPKKRILLDPRLIERSFGELQGTKKDDLTSLFPQYKGRNITKSFTDKPEGGEHFGDVEQRVWYFLNDCERKYEGKHILASTHHGPLRMIKKYFEDLSEKDALNEEVPHCSILHYS